MNLPTRLRTVLAADALVELLLGALLLATPSTIAQWFAIETAVALATGIVFVAAAAAVGLIARSSCRETVRMLAFGNVAGGAIGWAVLILAWTGIDAPGRALLGAGSDVFITLGALELIYLRKSARLPA